MEFNPFEKITELTSGIYTPDGRIINNLFYGGILTSILKTKEFLCLPHNGGVHTLRLRLSEEDLKAFFEIIDPIFRGREYYEGGLFVLRFKAGLL